MADLETTHLTPFDEMMQTRELQMLKTMVPYMNQGQQMQMVMLIQFLEFRHTYQVMREGNAALSACEIPEGTDKRSALLNELRCFCTPKEQETIDTLLNLFTILDNYELFLN